LSLRYASRPSAFVSPQISHILPIS